MAKSKEELGAALAPNTVLLVGVNSDQVGFDDTLEELALLADSAGLVVVDRLTCNRPHIDAATYVGSGKVEEIYQQVLAQGIQEVIFDQALSPAQQRNLERALKRPVYDRTFLILEIFSRRASSSEGKLQVELARLQYLSTRLVRRWSHLERQRGGIGARGGPGETQIELDRRMITQSLQRTKQRLRAVAQRRSTQRRQRHRLGLPAVSIVGYTNAGKSTLFNALVKAQAYAADQLFATLDTTTRQWYVQDHEMATDEIAPNGRSGHMLALSDTVGFIHNLPHTLVDAFQATLQEAIDADVLLHVVDASSAQLRENLESVMNVLAEIGADHLPQILVFNKADLLPVTQYEGTAAWPAHDRYLLPNGAWAVRVHVSALHKEGLQDLRLAVLQQLRPHLSPLSVKHA